MKACGGEMSTFWVEMPDVFVWFGVVGSWGCAGAKAAMRVGFELPGWLGGGQAGLSHEPEIADVCG